MEYTVFVDSDNRDQEAWPNTNSYTLHLTTPILNITRIELLSALFPQMTGGTRFVTIDIAELRTPSHLIAAALSSRRESKPTSNAFDGSFCTVPVTIGGGTSGAVFNGSSRTVTHYPARIDKLDRLTITLREPNSMTLLRSDTSRNSFLLRIETAAPAPKERDMALPTPVAWGDTGDRAKAYVLMAVALVGLLIIISAKRSRDS